ncbi:MAG: hypothetical protein ACLFQJ_04315 [Campylobacterales bacterium]
MKVELFRKKHSLWMRLLIGSITTKDADISKSLESFSDIEFRHMMWLANEIVKEYREFDYENKDSDTPAPKIYDFDMQIEPLSSDAHTMLEELQDELKVIIGTYGESCVLANRFKSDESYFLHKVEKTQNKNELHMYNSYGGSSDKVAKNLEMTPYDAEFIINSLENLLDKEYSSVISFFFLITHLEDRWSAEMLKDLMHESLSHMKYYASMMSSLGVLRMPKNPPKEEYMVKSLKEFIDNNIEDEKKEVEEMKEIALRVKYDDFKNLLRFVEEQELHHIDILGRIREAKA